MSENTLKTALVIGAAAAFGFITVPVALMQVAMAGMADVQAQSAKRKQEKDRQRGRTQMFRSPISPHQVVYGRQMVSGPILYGAVSGERNQFLHLIIALAGHEIDAVEEVWFDDKVSTEYDQFDRPEIVSVEYDEYDFSYDVTVQGVAFNGYSSLVVLADAVTASGVGVSAAAVSNGIDITASDNQMVLVVSSPAGYVSVAQNQGAPYRVNVHLGSDNQAADADLVAELPEWTSAHQLRGVAYAYVRLQWGSSWWPSGTPNIKFLVRGKPVFDPRVNAVAWSNNWAICVRDYLTASFGFNDPNVQDLAVVAEANICDEIVPAYFNGSEVTEPRYRLDGSFDLDVAPLDNLEDMLAAADGRAIWTFGEWKISCGIDRVVSDPTPISVDELRDHYSVQVRPGRANLFNSVRGTYISPEANWQPADIPPVTNALAIVEDGEQLWREIKLNYVNSPYQAQRLEKIALEKHRQSMVVDMPFMPGRAIQYEPGDVLELSIDDMGWVAKKFEVISWVLNDDFSVDVSVREYGGALIYDWNSTLSQLVDIAPNTTLPSPWYSGAPTNLAVFSGTSQLLQNANGLILSRMRIVWDLGDESTQFYDVQVKRSADVKWSPVATPAVEEYVFGPVEDGTAYDVRVQAINGMGVRSNWTQLLNHLVVGKTAKPSAVDAGSIAVSVLQDGTGSISWTHTNAPVDLASYRVYYGSVGAVLSAMTLWGGANFSPVILPDAPVDGVYDFVVLAVDTTGNLSVEERSSLTVSRDAVAWGSVQGVGRPADGATVGAQWGVNVAGIDADAVSGSRYKNIDMLSAASAQHWIPTALNNSTIYWVEGAPPVTGGGYVQTTGGTGWYVHDEFLSLTDDLIEIHFRLYVSSPGELYLGWEGYDQNGGLINASGAASSGGQHYHAAVAQTAAGWVDFKGYSMGRGVVLGNASVGTVQAPAKFHPSVSKIRPVFVVNYPQSSGFVSVDFVRIRVVQMAAESPYSDGQTIESLKPAVAGADVTFQNVAQGIQGQGGLATASSVSESEIDPYAVSDLLVNSVPGYGFGKTGDYNGAYYPWVPVLYIGARAYGNAAIISVFIRLVEGASVRLVRQASGDIVVNVVADLGFFAAGSTVSTVVLDDGAAWGDTYRLEVGSTSALLGSNYSWFDPKLILTTNKR